MLPEAELAALAEDVRAKGLLNPITLCDGAILDGRNRFEACRRAGVEPRFIDFVGGNPWDHVWSLNAERRHLPPGQKAVLAIKRAAASEGWRAEQEKRRADANRARARAAEGNQNAAKNSAPPRGGRPTPPPPAPPVSPRREAAAIAKSANVSTRTVERARALQKAAPERFEAVARGEVELHKALGEVKRAERVEKIVEIAKGNTALPTARYPVIYADPPWRYEHVETESRAIENQYPTMALDEICALPVGTLATPDAILFMWATSPKLAEAMRVVEAWGFTYRTSMVWVKDRLGMGYYARQRHELLLIATRGAPPTPLPADRPDSVVEAPRGEHSAKPAAFAELIERMYPAFPRVELFCRSPRAGWSVWGNQAA